MSYVNPLHPQVDPSQISHYSTLEGAIVTTTPLSPTRHTLPQQSFIPNSKWTRAMGQNVRLHPAIHFDYIGYNGQGVQMRELFARSNAAIAAMIKGARDEVLSHVERERISFRIIWPGYEHVESCDQLAINANGCHITRGQLGKNVAKCFARFMEKARNEHSRSYEWNLRSSGIRFEHLVLVALTNVWEGVWQADVVVDLRQETDVVVRQGPADSPTPRSYYKYPS
ncbi:hypothetical protein C0993_011011 [Termitomyces sp. T159_Od127]|nr:hypothetical protein C0993_011011 [Termitomyces sp. T159_Od127]